MERLLSTGTRGKIHPMAKTPIRSLCTQCRRRWAYPFYAHGRMPPWMLHAGWHRLCNECLSKLADDDAVTSATYDMWLRDRGAAQGGGTTSARIARQSGDKINRWDVFERDGWVCQICGEEVDSMLSGTDPRGPSLDHIIPISKGGTHTHGNVQLAHRRCNTRKGSRDKIPTTPPKPKKLAGEGIAR